MKPNLFPLLLALLGSILNLALSKPGLQYLHNNTASGMVVTLRKRFIEDYKDLVLERFI